VVFEVLTHLSMFQCPLVTDEGMEALANSSEELEVLDITGCTKLTTTSLVVLVKGLPKLRTLIAKLCRNINLSEFEFPHGMDVHF